ncbi:MAG: hypothetical protein ABF586_10370 [Sporolactobacillus sp.]
MFNFNKVMFAVFMRNQYKIEVDRQHVGEESVNLEKEELDECLISEKLRKRLPARITVHTCAYKEKNEWIVGVLCMEYLNIPLALICLKDGNKILEKIL